MHFHNFLVFYAHAPSKVWLSLVVTANRRKESPGGVFSNYNSQRKHSASTEVQPEVKKLTLPNYNVIGIWRFTYHESVNVTFTGRSCCCKLPWCWRGFPSSISPSSLNYGKWTLYLAELLWRCLQAFPLSIIMRVSFVGNNLWIMATNLTFNS